MLFLTNFYKDNGVFFNSNNLCRFTNFIGFQYYAVSNLNDMAFPLLKTIVGHSSYTFKFKPNKKKVLNTQFRF